MGKLLIYSTNILYTNAKLLIKWGILNGCKATKVFCSNMQR